MKWFSVILLLLAGCQSPAPEMVRSTTSVTVVEQPELETRGRAVWTDETCLILLREYPKCLGHEMMHCLSGHWHNELPNDDYCD